ncbi:uncharacterized protein LOC119720830 [Patiria miniata]|uniref:YqaJ viral recombinase domain-containing protein n=1 Tax=Patiria miniata TaxID=46514 RepID=A0A913Z4G3_PATMI|nr:uncharacterized protein LOC119720830 [Patiria miniata]
MAALLLWIQKNVSRTDLECKWSRPKPCKSPETPMKRLSQLTPSTSTAGIKRLVEEEDREWLLQRVFLLGRFTGIGWILSKEPEVVKQVKSYAFITSTPEFEHAPDKVENVVEHMAVSEEDVKVIERTTVGQRHNALWFAYKQNRLTSSNFGAVLGAVRRNSTPPSLLKTLRGEYGSAGRSSAIQWGVNHEDIALEKYSALSGCDVQLCVL